jgi:dTDP-4-dehydrorhamnose reductase
MKIIILGSKGQLGSEFVRRFALEKKYDLKHFSKQELDITDHNQINNIIKPLKPDIIINCAAYNLVDKAESTSTNEAYKVNKMGVLNLVNISKEINALLIHYSTDYVFDGKKEQLYSEDDMPNPINEYGKSKYEGENLIIKELKKYLIFRTSWVYGLGKQNFLYKLTQWIRQQDYLKIACDEFSIPTSTKTIVDITLKSIEKGIRGLFHLTNSDYCSRYEWGKKFLVLSGIKKFIYPAYQADFNLPAKRPRFSAMNNNKISSALKIEIPPWDKELEKMIPLLKFE